MAVSPCTLPTLRSTYVTAAFFSFLRLHTGESDKGNKVKPISFTRKATSAWLVENNSWCPKLVAFTCQLDFVHKWELPVLVPSPVVFNMWPTTVCGHFPPNFFCSTGKKNLFGHGFCIFDRIFSPKYPHVPAVLGGLEISCGNKGQSFAWWHQ